MKFLIVALMACGTIAQAAPLKWATEDMKSEDKYSPAGAVNNSIHADYAQNGKLLLDNDVIKGDSRLVLLNDLSKEDQKTVDAYFHDYLDYVLKLKVPGLALDKLEYIGVLYKDFVIGLILRATGHLDHRCHLVTFIYVPAGSSQPTSSFYNSCY